MGKNSKLYIAGHTGMVGSALMRKFSSEGFTNLVTQTFKELDLRIQAEVEKFFEIEKPEYVIIAAAKVGGILANNTYRAEFLYDNLMIQSNIIHASFKHGVKKLIFLGSSCIYPRDCPQPIREEYLLTAPLEKTNEPYAIAKIAGIKLCENYYKQYGCNFYSVMPTNLYGPNDNFDLATSHVLPALIRKFHEACAEQRRSTITDNRSPITDFRSQNTDNPVLSLSKDQSLITRNSSLITHHSSLITHNSVPVWGSGTPRREFLYVDDLADAIYYLMLKIEAKDIYEQGLTHLNIGTGKDLTIAELAELIKEVVGFNGKIVFDNSKPDGTPRKLLDVNRINNLGWKFSVNLKEGIEKTYRWFLVNYK
ncbi:MAG: GDP-L-fucose synthase [Bacteroidota bacterium]